MGRRGRRNRQAHSVAQNNPDAEEFLGYAAPVPNEPVAAQSSRRNAAASNQSGENASEQRRGAGRDGADFDRNLRKALATAGRQEAHSSVRARERARATLAARTAHLDKNDSHAVEAMVLFTAAQRGDINLAHEALMSGANPNKLLFEQKVAALHVAAQEGHIQLMRLFFEHGASVKTKDKKGMTPLHYAAAGGSIEAVQMLIDLKADVNAAGSNGETPLAAATVEDRAEIIQFLASHGARIDFVYGSRSALHLAAQNNCVKAAQVLINLHVNVNAVDNNGGTPLHCAAANGEMEIMRVLLKAGASVNAITRDQGLTPLHVAVYWGETTGSRCFEQAKLLLQYGASFTNWDTDSLAELCRDAIVADDKSFVKLLLDQGCDPDAILDADDSTLFGVAAELGNVEIGRLLMDYSAQESLGPAPFYIAVAYNQTRFLEFLLKNKTLRRLMGLNNRECMHIVALEEPWDYPGRKELMKVLVQNGISANTVAGNLSNTVLHEAARLGRVGAARVLVELGAHVNVRNANGETPLLLACRYRRLNIAKVLIEQGRADLDRRASDNSHPLYEAIVQKMPDVVKLLLDHDAPVDLPGPGGTTLLSLAVSMAETAIVRLLLNAGVDISEESADLLITAIVKQDLNTIRALVDAGIDVNECSDNGDVPLCIACENNMVMTVRLLLSAGARVDEVPGSNNIPLAAAVYDDADKEIIEMLLEAGADVNLITNYDNTVLHVAVADGRMDLVRLFLEHGADPLIYDDNDMTPLEIATQLGFEAIEILLSDYISRQVSQEPIRAPLIGELRLVQKPQRPSTSAAPPKQEKEGESELVSEMEKLFTCPITLEVMEDPVVAPDGHSYERSAITEWLSAHGRSPMTQQNMDVRHLVPNWNLKQQIEVFLRCHKGKT